MVLSLHLTSIDVILGSKKVKLNEGGSPDNLSLKSKKSQHTEHHTEKSSKSSTLSKAQIKAQSKQAEKIRKSVDICV